MSGDDSAIDMEVLLRELVENFRIRTDEGLMGRTQYSSLMLGHGDEHQCYWFCVSSNSMDEAALGHLETILRRAKVLLGIDPGEPITPGAVRVAIDRGAD